MGVVSHVPVEVQDDIEAAALWYEQERKELGIRFIAELDRLFDRIGSHPLQFPRVDAPVRRALLHQFPYAVYFVSEDPGGCPTILGACRTLARSTAGKRISARIAPRSSLHRPTMRLERVTIRTRTPFPSRRSPKSDRLLGM